MSTTRKGNNAKKGQRHQNSWAYKPDLHKTGKSSALSIQLTSLCPRCRDIIEWKIKYDKYKPLSAPGKCTVCGCRKVRLAYHHVCKECSSEKEVCGKCGKSMAEIEAAPKSLAEHCDHEQSSSTEETAADCVL